MKFDARTCRKFLGLKQRELAVKLGVLVREVQRWEARDISKRVTPRPMLIRRMKRLMQEKEFGISAERLAAAPPTVRRKLPPTNPAIGIAPSSW